MPSQPTAPDGVAKRRGPILAVAGLVAAAAGLAGVPTIVSSAQVAAAPTAVQVYWSSESRTAGYSPKDGNWFTNPAAGLAGTPHQLSRQADLTTAAAGGTATITADTTTRYQNVLGVGSSLEESTIYNLSRMNPTTREAVLRTLLDPNTGAGFNVARIPLGSSDFTGREFYTYDDGSPDPELTRFSIQKDIDYNIIAVLKQAKAINPDLVLFGSVWSPPAWMKTNNSLIGGSLADSSIPVLAAYFRKAVQAYADQGLPLHAVTMQNEPLFSPPDYPGTTVTADQERRLAVAMRAEFTAHGVGATKIWAFDHNFGDGVNYSAGVLGAPGSPSDAVDGVAFHDYGGDPPAMAEVKANYPSKDVAMTERAVWGTSGADRIIQYFRNQSIMYQDWVTMLDQNRSPEKWSGSPDPTMLVQSTTDPNTYWALPEYYMIAQFSKFVKRGAARVKTDYGSTGTVTNVAFHNPDGTLVTVAVNQTSSDQPVTLRVGAQQVTATLPAKTVGTYLWPDADSDGSTPTNLAEGKPTTASSTENAGTPATAATDGDASTRWSSAFGDPQWLQVDLGRSYDLDRVSLNWEAAYARDYQVQTSQDGSTWTTRYSTTSGDGGTDDLAITGSGRYVRVYATARATQFGYSLWELEVAGTTDGTTTTTTSSTTTTTTSTTTTTPTTTTTVQPGTIKENVYYRITAGHSGKALDVRDASTTNGAGIQQWDYTGGPNQRWRFVHVGGGYYRIVAKNSGKSLDLKDLSTANGAQVQQWDYSGGQNQQWQVSDLGTGAVKITSRLSGRALDIRDSSTANGAALQQWDYDGGPNQQWTLTEVETIP